MGFRNLITNLLVPPQPKAVKTSAAGPMIAWSHVGQPRWTPRRFENLAEAGFRKNVVAYRCVMQVATASAAIPWLLYEGDEELDRHPLLNLLRHPNPLQDGMAFLESVYAYLEIAGNAFIEAVRPQDDEAPIELYALRPDRMKVIPGPTGLPQGYQYTVNGQVTSWAADPITGASNILHLKQFHPLDDWYGMAPLEAAQISVDQHNAAGSWNQALLSHGARPSGALVFAPKDGPATLTDEQMQRLREELGQVYQGSSNAGRPLILEGGLDWREMSLSPKDMDWLAGRNTAARDIALAFGVPAQLVGIPDAQTYANMAEARMALYEETVLPLVNRVLGGFDHWLAPMYGDDLELDYDPDEVSALAVRRDTQWNKLQTTDFLTINEKRHAVGYGPIEGGDVLDNATSKKPAAAGTGAGTGAAPASAPAQTPNAPFTPAPTATPNAWSHDPKFNPYHDPDNGQFTFGPGGSGDDSDDDEPDDSSDDEGDNGGNTATPVGASTPVSPDTSLPKPSLEGDTQVVDASGQTGSAPASDAQKPSFILPNQPPAGKDPGAVTATYSNGTPIKDSNGDTLLMPKGVSLDDNAALGEKLSILPSVFAPGIIALNPLAFDANPVPAKEIAMTSLFYYGQPMDYQRIYSDNVNINPQYTNFGNYNYGVVAAAAGYSFDETLFASGMFNLLGRSDHSGLRGNNPKNIPWITQGFNDYTGGLLE